MPGVISTAESREQIFAALNAVVAAQPLSAPINGLTGWGGSARKWVDPSQIALEQLPFLAQWEGPSERYERPGNRLPPIRILGARLIGWMNVTSGDALQIGSTYVSTMLETIENALLPDTGGYGSPGLFTLGGLVQWCRIEGVVMKNTGDTEQFAMVNVPIRILVP
jgi:hypothetical protein